MQAAKQAVWAALADPTRRAIIDRLGKGALSTTQLTAGAGMTRFGVAKHLGVLESAGLVVSRKHGRVRLYHLNAAKLDALQDWLSPRARAWGAGAQNFTTKIKERQMAEPLPVHRVGAIDIALDWEVSAPVSRTWKHFFSAPEAWWPREFRALGANTQMRFEPRVGAQLVEEDGEGAALAWYTIFALKPQSSVDLHGLLAARYGGPTTSVLHIEFLAGATAKSCTVKLTDSLFGRLGPQTAQSVADGWRAIMGSGFVESLGTPS